MPTFSLRPAKGKVSHFGTEYRKTSLPADKKGPVREVQQSTRRRKEVTKRLEYQPQTSKSTRHRHCRAKLRVYRDDHPSRPRTANPQKLPSLTDSSTARALNLPCYSTNTVTRCKPIERSTKQTLLALPQHYTAPTATHPEVFHLHLTLL